MSKIRNEYNISLLYLKKKIDSPMHAKHTVNMNYAFTKLEEILKFIMLRNILFYNTLSYLYNELLQLETSTEWSI